MPPTPPAAHKIINLCFKQFHALPKTGKPTNREWTVLAGVVQQDAQEEVLKCVALGAGTKCIGQNESLKTNQHGCTLNDSHAEVLARRALLRYFYQQLKMAAAAATNKNAHTPPTQSIFTWSEAHGLFQLRPDISFHFLSTQTPCGDACIIAGAEADLDVNILIERTQQIQAKQEQQQLMAKNNSGKEQREYKDAIKSLLEKEKEVEEISSAKRRKIACTATTLDNDTIGSIIPSSAAVRTGAKLIGAQHMDAMHQCVGAMRTKPGRGDRTLSMSCSDKLAKWNLLGVQGALLDALLILPIYFETLNFACDSNLDAIKRTIYGRFQQRTFKSDRFQMKLPDIRICTDVTFEYAPQQEPTKNSSKETRIVPSPNGLVWCLIAAILKPYEVSVNGRRQGVSAKHPNKLQVALKISRYYLLQEFVDLLSAKSHLIDKFNLKSVDLSQMSYDSFKRLAQTYQTDWAKARLDYFHEWTQKPAELLAFSLVNYHFSFKI